MNPFEKAVDMVDACIYTGDALRDVEHRVLLKEHIARWQRALVQYDMQDRRQFEQSKEKQ